MIGQSYLKLRKIEYIFICYKRWKIAWVHKNKCRKVVRVFSKHIINIKVKKTGYWNYWMYDWKGLVSILKRWFRSGKRWWNFLIHTMPMPQMAKQGAKAEQRFSQRHTAQQQQAQHIEECQTPLQRKKIHHERLLHHHGIQTLEEAFIRHMLFIDHCCLTQRIQNKKTCICPWEAFYQFGKSRSNIFTLTRGE